jgi:hypothetical protein
MAPSKGKHFKSFKMSETTYNQINSLPENQRLKFYSAVCNYGINGIEPTFTGIEYSVWIPMKDLIDYSNERSRINSENGKKGGAPEGNQNRKKTKSTKINQNQPNILEVSVEAGAYGFFIDSKTAKDICECGIEPSWLCAPFSFIEFCAERILEKYEDKSTNERKAIFISAIKTWDDLRNEYPEWRLRKEKTAHYEEEIIARENHPKTCGCGGKLVVYNNNELLCTDCHTISYVFDQDTLQWLYTEPDLFSGADELEETEEEEEDADQFVPTKVPDAASGIKPAIDINF